MGLLTKYLVHQISVLMNEASSDMVKCPVYCCTCNPPQFCVQYGRSELLAGENDLNIQKHYNKLLKYT